MFRPQIFNTNIYQQKIYRVTYFSLIQLNSFQLAHV